MGKSKYIKCPRCDLNYIESTHKLCDVCKAELGLKSKIVLYDDYSNEELLKLCPICKANYISYEEEMCDSCKGETTSEFVPEETDNDETWRGFLDDENDLDDEQDEIPLDEFKEFEEDLDEEDQEIFEDEDFDFVEADDLSLEEYDEDFDEDEEFDDDEDMDEEDF